MWSSLTTTCHHLGYMVELDVLIWLEHEVTKVVVQILIAWNVLVCLPVGVETLASS